MTEDTWQTLKTGKTMTENELIKLKPSELIKLALHDLAQVRKEPKKYTVHMAWWHEPSDWRENHCLVCLAGAVMAKELESDIEQSYGPSDFSIAVDHLAAIENFCKGDISVGVERMRYTLPYPFPKLRHIASYHQDSPKQFRQDLWELIHDLKQAGL